MSSIGLKEDLTFFCYLYKPFVFFSVKMFVGGLSWQTNEDHLQQYFSQFGTIDNVQIMKDPFTLVSIQIFLD